MGTSNSVVSPSPEDDDYYTSLRLMADWFDIELIRSAKVLVVGAGAIGNEVLKNLALIGVSNIFIFDRDTIDRSNLSRSILYGSSDVGRQKAERAAEAIRCINPDVGVSWLTGDSRIDLGLGLLRRMNVIIGCLDNVEARYELNRDCWRVNRPWVEAGITQLNGQVRVYRPGHGACYECSFTESDYHQVTRPCAQIASLHESEDKVPTLSTAASIVAGVQVQEALKLLDPGRWENRSLVGRGFYFNGTKAEAKVLSLPQRPNCFAHSTIPEELLVELPEATAEATTAADLLREARERLGPTADLKLNFDLVVEARCRGCGVVARVLKPLYKLHREDLNCKKCGRPSEGFVTDLVTTNYLGSARPKYTEDFLDRPLTKLGVPRLDILLARGPYRRGYYFELSGDAQHALRFEKLNTLPRRAEEVN